MKKCIIFCSILLMAMMFGSGCGKSQSGNAGNGTVTETKENGNAGNGTVTETKENGNAGNGTVAEVKESGDAPVTIHVLQSAVEYSEAFSELFDEYKKVKPNVTFELEVSASETHQLLKAKVSAGDILSHTIILNIY